MPPSHLGETLALAFVLPCFGKPKANQPGLGRARTLCKRFDLALLNVRDIRTYVPVR
jgi:hypothetical protein